MHASVMEYVSSTVAELNLSLKKTLDVGSRDVNGSVRELFLGEYVGVDIEDGPNVDHVCSSHEIVDQFGPRQWEVIVCTEMLEHDEQPFLTMEAFSEALVEADSHGENGGILIVTTRGPGFPLHEHPRDYWRFTKDGLTTLLNWGELWIEDLRHDPEQSGVFAVASKR